MRKKQYVIPLCITAVLIVASICLFILSGSSSQPLSVVIRCEDGEREITCWENGEDQIYAFLPGGVSLENAHLINKIQENIVIDGRIVDDEIACSEFSLNVSYSMTYSVFGKRESKTLTIVQSGGVPTMFITTQSGDTKYLHVDKENKESGTVSLYTADGRLDYHGKADSIGGRGNYSWTEHEKKPYNVVLSQTANLLDMGMGSKWVLLNNASDATLMRNKIAYDFAAQIGLNYSPESQWVDLYLNGEYCGLYLLSEAIEISADRVDISPTEGAVLIVETEDVFKEKQDKYIITNAGVAVGIHSPKTIDKDKIAKMTEKISSVENAILAQDSIDLLTGKSLEELIDLDSWSKKYLLEEVFGNLDAFMRSTYFYYSGDSDLLCAGPVWDYDKSMGNPYDGRLINPQTFWGNRPAGVRGWDTPWIYALCQKEEFYQRVNEIYQMVFLPELEQLFHVTIKDYAEEISCAASVNKIRWKDDTTLTEAVDILCEYMEQRIEVLKQVWIEKRDYCIVRLEYGHNGCYVYNITFTGDHIENLPEFADTEVADFVGLYNVKTGEIFDAQQPIVEDIEIIAKWQTSSTKRSERIVKLVPLAVITVMGVALAAVEIRRWRKCR